MSELPDEVRDKIYSLRLYNESATPIDEYIKQFCVILVDDCLYHLDDEFSRMIVNDFKKSEENGLRFKRFTLPNAIIKDGCVIKNRFGQKEEVCND